MREYIATVKEVHELDMLVEYTAPGFEPIMVGVLRPLAGEDPGAILRSYAPEAQWEWIERSRAEKQDVRLGYRLIANVPTPAPEPEAPVLEIKRAEL